MPAKRKRETLEDVLARPWCYYCDRHFDDLKVLHDHQKQKHFQCTTDHCNRRLNTVGGLRVHLQQVHKQELDRVPNANEGREDTSIEIFGMEGVPADVLSARHDIIMREWHKRDAEYRRLTGNPYPGGTTNNDSTNAPKKAAKVESSGERKARVAELKASLAAKKAAKAAGVTGESASSKLPTANGPGEGISANANTLAGNVSTPSLQSALPYNAPPTTSSPHMRHPAMPSALNQPPPALGYGHHLSGADNSTMSSSPRLPGFGGPLPNIPGTNLQAWPAPIPPPPAPTHQIPNNNSHPGLRSSPPFGAHTLPVRDRMSLSSHLPLTQDQDLTPPMHAPVDPSSVEAMINEQAMLVAKQIEENKKQRANNSEQAENSNVQGPRTGQILTGVHLSWEERRARNPRYHRQPRASTMATDTAVQGATGVVDGSGELYHTG